MVMEKLYSHDGWIFPINEKGEPDWLCPRCGHEHTSCCGNSHFPCKKGPNYGGDCKCTYLDDLMPKIPSEAFVLGDKYPLEPSKEMKCPKCGYVFTLALKGDKMQ